MLDGKKVTITISNGEGGDFTPIPADKYTVQIVDVSAVEAFNKFKGKDEIKLNYQFAILDPKKEDDKFQSLRGRFLWHRVSPTFNEKSWLEKLTKAVYGRTLDDKEKSGWDPESIIGKQVDVLVAQVESKTQPGKMYANITSYAACRKQLEPIEFTPKPSVVEKSSVPVTAPKEDNATEFEKLMDLAEKDGTHEIK